MKMKWSRIIGKTALAFLLWQYAGITIQKPCLAAEPHPALKIMPVPVGLGVNIHFFGGNERDWAMLTDAGVGIVRMDVSWQHAEKQPGVYNFSDYDSLIQNLQQRDIRLLFILDYGNPLYDNGFAPHSEKALAAFAKFCRALAQRYQGKGIIYELWNEPNLDHFWKPAANVDQYMAWCRRIVPAIREVDSSACIIGPAVSRVDLPFLEACFQRGLLELVDGVSVHPYRNPRLAVESVEAEYRTLSVLIEQYRPVDRVIPVISGEWGYSTTFLSAKAQGKYLARQWLFNMASDVPVSIWYDWHDDGQDPHNSEHNFGTVTWEYRPKDAFRAMKTMIRELHGAVPMCRLNIGSPDDYAVLFRTAQGACLTLWTTAESHPVELGEDVKIQRAVDYLGQEKDGMQGRWLTISDAPLYLHIGKPLPAWVNLLIQADSLTGEQAETFVAAFLKQNSNDRLTRFIQDNITGASEVEQNAVSAAMLLAVDKLPRTSLQRLPLLHWLLMQDDLLAAKGALDRLAAIGSVTSRHWVALLEQKPPLLQAVAAYYLHIAWLLSKQGQLDSAEDLLLKATGLSSQRFLVDRVMAVLEKNGYLNNQIVQRNLAQTAGFITQWWIAGPFPNANREAVHRSYFPEQQIDYNEIATFDSITARWQKIDVDGIYSIIDFAGLYGTKPLAAYAHAEIISPDTLQLMLKIGSNDGVVCWLNGEKIHENIIGRTLTVDEDVVPVQFIPGVNRILLKVLNDGLAWEACLRVCDRNGVPLNLNKLSQMQH